ncbi:MAG: aminotransferase class V-fold PLP-dependent enzyme [Longimonas sp.]|uniref:aminotransferase class V-fold PLP-dependent enzyme n=1 Tax=Longimonas sp. TaxID=2039626 RepID=UPI0033494AF0
MPTTDRADLRSLRNAFVRPGPDDAVELRAFTHGLMPKRVPDMLQRFAEDWSQRGVDAWNAVPNHWQPDTPQPDDVGWWTLPMFLGDAFIAPLLGAPHGTCVMQPHVHWTMQCLLSAPEVIGRGSEVVLVDSAFPSVRHSVHRWQALNGLEPSVATRPESGHVAVERVIDRMGAHTAMVVLSHVGFTTGQRIPDRALRAVADAAHANDALFVIDGYHSACTFPIDVAALGADVYMGGLLKEGCGSSGNGFVYLREGLDLTPRLTGWFGNAEPFAFHDTPSPHPDVRRRFLGGTTAVASLYHAVEGVRLLLDAGLDTVHAHTQRLSQIVVDRAGEAPFSMRSPRHADERSALLVLEVPDAYQLCEYLKTRRIYTDSRKNRFIRMAPFVWNTAPEVHHALDVLTDAIESKAYRSFTPEPGGPVT